MDKRRNFRVALDLKHFYEDHRLFSRIFISKNMCSINDLKEKISRMFNIDSFYLKSRELYLPDAEDLRILDYDEVITAFPMDYIETNNETKEKECIKLQKTTLEFTKPVKRKQNDDLETEVIKRKKKKKCKHKDYLTFQQNCQKYSSTHLPLNINWRQHLTEVLEDNNTKSKNNSEPEKNNTKPDNDDKKLEDNYKNPKDINGKLEDYNAKQEDYKEESKHDKGKSKGINEKSKGNSEKSKGNSEISKDNNEKSDDNKSPGIQILSDIKINTGAIKKIVAETLNNLDETPKKKVKRNKIHIDTPIVNKEHFSETSKIKKRIDTPIVRNECLNETVVESTTKRPFSIPSGFSDLMKMNRNIKKVFKPCLELPKTRNIVKNIVVYNSDATNDSDTYIATNSYNAMNIDRNLYKNIVQSVVNNTDYSNFFNTNANAKDSSGNHRIIGTNKLEDSDETLLVTKKSNNLIGHDTLQIKENCENEMGTKMKFVQKNLSIESKSNKSEDYNLNTFESRNTNKFGIFEIEKNSHANVENTPANVLNEYTNSANELNVKNTFLNEPILSSNDPKNVKNTPKDVKNEPGNNSTELRHFEHSPQHIKSEPTNRFNYLIEAAQNVTKCFDVSMEIDEETSRIQHARKIDSLTQQKDQLLRITDYVKLKNGTEAGIREFVKPQSLSEASDEENSFQGTDSCASLNVDKPKKRKRVRKRKKKPAEGCELIVATSTPFRPPKVRGKPLIHIKFEEDEGMIGKKCVKNVQPINNESLPHFVQNEETCADTNLVSNNEGNCMEIDSLDCMNNANPKNDLNTTYMNELNRKICKKIENGEYGDEWILKFPKINAVAPKKGDLIAFKILKLGDGYTPEISSIITGEVFEFNKTSNKIQLFISVGIDEFVEPSGKFSLINEEAEYNNDNDQNRLKELIWTDLIDARLINLITPDFF